MNISGSDSISADKVMININADTVLMAEVVTAILFNQPASKSFCCSRSGFSPPLWEPPGFDLLILFAGVALLGNRDESCIDDGIWNAVHHSKADKLLKRSPVTYLEFKLFITEVKKLLKNEHLEKDDRINPLAPCAALRCACDLANNSSQVIDGMIPMGSTLTGA